MYFIVLFILTWIWFFLQADKSRLRELYGVMVYSSFLGLLTDLIMVHYKLWSYRGLPDPLFTIPLLLDFSIYPIVTYLFVQNLPASWKDIWKRTLVWTMFAIFFEWVTLETHHMHHHLWWNLGYSFIADITIYLSIAGLYRFYSPAYLREGTHQKRHKPC
jgi:hypothetical protein